MINKKSKIMNQADVRIDCPHWKQPIIVKKGRSLINKKTKLIGISEFISISTRLKCIPVGLMSIPAGREVIVKCPRYDQPFKSSNMLSKATA